MLKTLYQLSYDFWWKPHVNLIKRRNDVFRHEKSVIAPHTLSKKNGDFDFMQRCPCSCANTFIVLAF